MSEQDDFNDELATDVAALLGESPSDEQVEAMGRLLGLLEWIPDATRDGEWPDLPALRVAAVHAARVNGLLAPE